MSSLPLRSLVLISLLLAPACGEGALPRPGDGPALQPSGVDVALPTLESLLREGTALELDVGANAEQPSEVSFRLAGELAVDAPACEMQVASGHLTLWLREDGTLELAGLKLGFADQPVEAQPMLPDGLVLTQIEASLTRASLDAVVWHADGASLSSHGQLDLLLDWAWRPVDDPDDLHPLASQSVAELSMTLRMAYDDERGLSAELHAERQGQVWRIANLLGDGDLVSMQDPALGLRSTP